ncbi:hypothetical protein IEQ34_016960 [Dendrobium chrysotoxum]|uniref:Uncharacterized protein n=1 Tax=Dendrobium chrysotoxum TaxID=161865 RepID=A0AAV7GF37_DENCH|nr:hypothetical protein IEQ34_016960 [Dendrobium chrysotoxum]
MTGENPSSRDRAVKGGSHPATQNDGERRPNKRAKEDDVVSTVISDSLIVLHKKFHFPNNLVAMVPKRSDRASLPPPGYLAIYKTSLQAGLVTPVTVGLIAFFRDRGAVLMPECLSGMGRFTSDAQGHASTFFFVKNDWGLIEKWWKMKDSHAPLHVGEEDILRILNIPNI